MSKVGGLSAVKSVTHEIQDLVNKAKTDVELNMKTHFSVFEAVEYKTQVVAGTNYIVKVKTGCDEYIHIRIFKDLKGKSQLISYEPCETAHSEIFYF